MQTTIELSGSERRHILITVIACISVVGLSLGMTVPLVSLVLERQGTESTAIGLVAAMPAVGILICSPFIPWLVARFGPKRILYLGVALAGSSVFALSYATNIWLWLGMRLLMGVADAMLFTISETWINQVAAEHNRGRLVALYATVLSVCLAAGPLLITITGTEGPTPFILASIILFLAAAPVAGMRGRLPRIEGAASFGVLRFLRVAPSICAAVLLFAFIDGAGISLLPVFGIRHGYSEYAAALMVTVLVGGNIGLQIPIGWLADKINRYFLLLMLGCCLLASSTLLPVATQSWLLWPLLFVLGAAAGGVYTLSLIIVGQQFRGVDLVAANAAIGVLWGLGNLAGPLTTGLSMQAFGALGFPLVFAAATACFIAVFLHRHRLPRQFSSPPYASKATDRAKQGESSTRRAPASSLTGLSDGETAIRRSTVRKSSPEVRGEPHD